MFSNLKLITKLSIVLGILILSMVAITYLGIQNLGQINDRLSHIVDNSAEKVRISSRARQNLLGVSRAEKNMLLSKDQADLENYANILKEERSALNTRLDKLSNLVDEQGKKELGFLKQDLEGFYTVNEEVRELARQNNNDAAFDLASGKGRELIDQAETRLRNIADFNEQDMDQQVTQARADYETAVESMTIMATLAILIASVIGAFISLSQVAAPLKRIAKAMSSLSNGKLDIDVPFTKRTDEVGEMAQAVLIFKKSALRNQELEAQQEERERRAEEERRSAMIQMADRFELSIGKIVETVTSAATELQSSAAQMSSTATETSSQASTVAAAAEEASTNVETVAAATEELTSSELEISRQVQQSSKVADQAANQADQTKDTVENMMQEVSKIGTIISLIQEIAEQTNLLALNATIEAARAGDTGKGFAVVASEVKNLATQTAKATEEISNQINQVQTVTHTTADAIHEIGETITEIDQIANSIAAAVEEQTAATSEISRNVSEASVGTSQVTSNIQTVEQAAGETGSAASEIDQASSELSQQAETLREEVQSFLDKVRNDNALEAA